MNFCRYLVMAALVSSAFAGQSFADECRAQWQAQMSTSANVPKGMSGDTHAAYAVFAYQADPNLHLVMQATFPRARFFSFESYRGHLLRNDGDAMLDYQLIPDPGSRNPFAGDGVFASNQTYRLDVVSEGFPGNYPLGPNVLRVPSALFVQAIMLRIYAPDTSIVPSDLPNVWAFDARTGLPRPCPRLTTIPFELNFPQVIGQLLGRSQRLDFKVSGVASGQNAAIPGYAYALTAMRPDEVAVIRFRAPQLGRDVRYYSVCVQNFLGNETRACISDSFMRVDVQGFVNLAISEDVGALQRAAVAGYSVLHFSRAPRQAAIGIVYRNILPTFGAAYLGDYLPQGWLYHGSQF